MLDFQLNRLSAWYQKVFQGRTDDVEERCLRLIEEVLELSQARGVDLLKIIGLAYQVYGKPPGNPEKELGGVLSTLGAYCFVTGQDPTAALEAELIRIESPELIKRIRKKHDEKLVVSSESRRQMSSSEIADAEVRPLFS